MKKGVPRGGRCNWRRRVWILALATWLVAAADLLAQDGGQGSAGDELTFFNLLIKGGWFMLPILLVSLLAATFSIERLLGLRLARVLPDGLVTGLGQLGGPGGGFDPRRAYRLCQQYPSAAANVVKAMLVKIGRPHTEVEQVVREASQREAIRLYANVRWLNLSTAIAPLMGLLGTVWGMIRAFHDTAFLLPGQNKADYLARGIYEALVTTLAGLLVAIPSAMLAHYFEGRIQSLFLRIDELVFTLMPQIERFEGRVRVGRELGDGRDTADGREPPEAKPESRPMPPPAPTAARS